MRPNAVPESRRRSGAGEPVRAAGFSRRRMLLTMLGVSALAAPPVDAVWIERKWLRTVRLRFSPAPRLRLVHVTDLHFKGDLDYLRRVVQRINAARPDFVCFTGDMVEDARFLDTVLTELSRVASPLFGVPGNHDYGSRAPFAPIRRCFTRTRGAWIEDGEVMFNGPQVRIRITGMTGLGRFVTASGRYAASLRSTQSSPPVPLPNQETGGEGIRAGRGRGAPEIRILLVHYPQQVDFPDCGRYDLILAGHSHGGQVRLPGVGALILPHGVGRYDRGLFRTPRGPLYVNSGIGTWLLPMRFACRPEITIIEV